MSDAPSTVEAEADRWDDERRAEWAALDPDGRADYGNNFEEYCAIYDYVADVEATDDAVARGPI